MLHCDFTNKLWEEIDPVLKELHPTSVTDEEKAFGIVLRKHTTGTMLRNWLTYLLRECIAKEERAAYHSRKANLEKVKHYFNNIIQFEISKKAFRYKNENNLPFFDKIIAHAQALKIMTQELFFHKF